jgi:lysophospholipase L1-like esterase
MNLNPKAQKILCFGDSNVWGYISNSVHQRYSVAERWTGILQQTLGDDFEIIEEGLNSRGIVKGDSRPGKEGRSAIEYIIPCLDTHDPIDHIVILLGTNELKSECGLSVEQIGQNMETFLGVIQGRSSQFRDIKPGIILLAPTLVNEDTDYCKKGDKYKGARQKSIDLGPVFEKLAGSLGIKYLNLGPIASVGEDGIHMTLEGHKVTAAAVARLF